MNLIGISGLMEALQATTAPFGPRALLVTLDASGAIEHQPVAMGQSLVRLETELIDHLNARPLSDEFIESLRDYCEGRLAARAEAERSGGFVIPRATNRWEIAHAPAWAPIAMGAR